ncbi:MAG: nucleotidyltransferase domain-containing protein [Acutalibacteraceae bacterium]
MDNIIEYIKEKYHPYALIVYGSFADGTNNMNSDFDALAIADVFEKSHDNSVIDGTELDLFIYPTDTFNEKTDLNDFDQIYDSKIVLDTDGIALKLVTKVRNYIDSKPKKSKSENHLNVEWCEKMLLRIQRNDPEGFFRLHWLLVDSLEIYFDLIGTAYQGPKKGLRKMSEIDRQGYDIYVKALSSSEYVHIQQWVRYLRKICESN